VNLVRDETLGVYTHVLPCRSCGQPCYFSLNTQGKRAIYEVDDKGFPTRINHFTRCPEAKLWRKKR